MVVLYIAKCGILVADYWENSGASLVVPGDFLPSLLYQQIIFVSKHSTYITLSTKEKKTRNVRMTCFSF